jgi:spore maturation protein CgeB
LKETHYTIHVVGGLWNSVFEEGNEEKRLKITDWKPPHEVPDCYNSAKIILNTHRPHDLAENKNSVGVINRSINNRTFDVSACGAFQLISHQPDLRDYFSEEEIVSFENNEDLLHKIHFYLKNEQKRKQIALNAREKILKHHTFVHRIKELLTLIQQDS